MSRHHTSKSNEVAHLILDTKNMTHRQMIETYNAEVWESGQVYDLTTKLVHANVKDWANAIVEDEVDDSEHNDLWDSEWEEL